VNFKGFTSRIQVNKQDTHTSVTGEVKKGSSQIFLGQVSIGIMVASGKPAIDWSKGIIDWHLPINLEATTFLAVGDILVEESFLGKIADVIKTKGGAFLFDPTRSILKSADIVLGNLENPLSERGVPIFKWGPHFRGSPKMAEILRNAGFTVLGVANNHARDYGDYAFLDTLKCLRSVGILPVGGGQDITSALEPVVVKTRKISIGIFAFTYRQESVAKEKQPGAADLDNPECYEAVKALRGKVDSIIVHLHMDPEHSDYPAPHRIRMARRFIDIGAEMVIGHHPHVPQGLEIYKNKLIAYSLGNFLFHTQNRRPLTKFGYLMKITFTRKGTASAKVIPYKINDCYQPVLLSNKERENFLKYFKNVSKGLHNPETVRLNWEEIASLETMSITKHILQAILARKPYSLWSCHLTLFKYRIQPFLRGLLNFKVPGYFSNLMHTQLNTRSYAHESDNTK